MYLVCPYSHQENYRYNNIICYYLTPLKTELAELLEDAKADKLRSLPCIAAELLAFGLYVQSAMIRYTTGC
jgi:hypothetical protein